MRNCKSDKPSIIIIIINAQLLFQSTATVIGLPEHAFLHGKQRARQGNVNYSQRTGMRSRGAQANAMCCYVQDDLTMGLHNINYILYI